MSWWPLRGSAHPGPSLSLIKPTEREEEREGTFLPKVSSGKKKVQIYSRVVIHSQAMRNVEIYPAKLLHPHLADWETEAHPGEEKGTHRSQDRAKLKPRPPNSQTTA